VIARDSFIFFPSEFSLDILHFFFSRLSQNFNEVVDPLTKKMKIKLTFLLLLCMYSLNTPAVGQIQRHIWSSVPLDDDFNFGQLSGLSDRGYDHATVAMNNERDVLVAFHSVRGDRNGDLIGPGLVWAGGMKQVEVAFFDYSSDGGIESWTHLDTKIIGSVDHDPVPQTNQTIVKCERPDVVAVDDMFFVVWTRRYHDGIPNQDGQPAVLECAWIAESGNPADPINVFAHSSGNPGRGYALDSHTTANPFQVKECAGTVDAVKLDNGDDDLLEVAVVYPHVISYAGNPTGDRTFELRVATCSFQKSTSVIEKEDGYPKLAATVPFNGPPTPGGLESPGLVLPDLAPSGETKAFWMVYERQKMKPVTGSPDDVADGRIKLEYYQHEPGPPGDPGTWEQRASKTFKGSTDNWAWRRRPMISSFPEGDQQQYAAVAFSKASSVLPPLDSSPDVFFEIWEYDNGSLSNNSATIQVYAPWPNFNNKWDDRPLPTMGKLIPLEARFFATREDFPPSSSVPVSLRSFNPAYPSTMSTLDADVNGFTGVRRPAASYHYQTGAPNPHYYAVTWEKEDASSQKKVYVYFD